MNNNPRDGQTTRAFENDFIEMRVWSGAWLISMKSKIRLLEQKSKFGRIIGCICEVSPQFWRKISQAIINA
jgi:hypothetical protein